MRITKNWKNILSIGLAVLVLFGAVGAVASFATNDTKTIGFGEFEIGSLSEVDGQYVEDKTAIYTKDAFECQGLKVKPEFDSDVTYQIFFYNEDELFISCTEKTTSSSAQYLGGAPFLAKYCRIVIFPSQIDEDGKVIKNFKVNIFDIPKIVNNLNITVYKEQEFESVNIFCNLTSYNDSMGTKNEVLANGKNILIENTSFSSEYTVNLKDTTFSSSEGWDIIKVQSQAVSVYKVDLRDGGGIECVFYDSTGKYLNNIKLKGGELHLLEVPESNDDLIIVFSYEKLGENSSMVAYLPKK